MQGTQPTCSATGQLIYSLAIKSLKKTIINLRCRIKIDQALVGWSIAIFHLIFCGFSCLIVVIYSFVAWFGSLVVG